MTPELAELLVPVERSEPYRFREPSEVDAVCRESFGRHVPTRVRVLGRSSVRTVSSGYVETVA